MASNIAEVTSKGSFSSTVNPASGKPDGAVRSTEQKEKRSHSEVADNSIGDEFASIQKQLDQLSSEVKQAREDFKTLMTKDEMKTFIKNTIQKMVTTVQTKVEESLGKRMDEKIDEKIDAELEGKLEKKLDEKVKEKLDEANTRMDLLTYETVQLKEEVDKLKKELNKSKNLAETAAQKANTNEQYSRKNNVKIMGVVEDEDENEERLTRKVQNILEGKAGLKLEDSKIMTLHRIPGKIGMPKPVLLKLKNNNDKTRIMRKRKEMKLSGYRLVDDVTKENTKFIRRLMEHKDIDSAWYFNGSVFAKGKTGKRYKFDIHSVIDDVLEGKKKERSGEGSAAEPMTED